MPQNDKSQTNDRSVSELEYQINPNLKNDNSDSSPKNGDSNINGDHDFTEDYGYEQPVFQLPVLDSEEDQDQPVIEVMFKGNRRELFSNDLKKNLKQTDLVIVNTDNGTDAGIVTNCCVHKLNRLKNLPQEQQPKHKLIRTATTQDKATHRQNLNDSMEAVAKTRQLVKKHELDMKITEAEWQFDRQRLTIYFTAPQRIDFRELVKDLARTFRTRIELRQISSREETKRLGFGIGPCGQKLCCTSFIHDFCHVTLDHARTQQLSTNVAKLSGNCGRLKCCLLFEHDTYVEAFEKYPPLDAIIETEEGKARIMKVDIFKDLVYIYIRSASKYKSISYEELDKYRKAGKIKVPASNQNNSNHN